MTTRTTVAKGPKQNFKQPNGVAKWPSHASIVLPASGGALRLTDQDPLVSHVITGAIADLTRSCFFDSAWPINTETGEWRRALLLESANRSIEKFPLLDAFISRIHSDISFGYSLGALVSLLYFFMPISDAPLNCLLKGHQPTCTTACARKREGRKSPRVLRTWTGQQM